MLPTLGWGFLTTRRPARTLAQNSRRGCADFVPIRALAERDDYSGMLPCLRGGRDSRFVSAVSSASMSTGRVRRGSITSST
jgi:hypothetical protein